MGHKNSRAFKYSVDHAFSTSALLISIKKYLGKLQRKWLGWMVTYKHGFICRHCDLGSGKKMVIHSFSSQ